MLGRGDIIVIGIGGATCGGKTTLVSGLIERFPAAEVVHQDHFYKSDEDAPWSDTGETRLWDIPESLYLDQLMKDVERHKDRLVEKMTDSADLSARLLIIEGTMVATMELLKPVVTMSWFFTLDYDTMLHRRGKRKYIGDPDIPTYFDDYLWPCYNEDLKTCKRMQGSNRPRLIDGTRGPEEILDEVHYTLNELLYHRKP